MKVKLLEFLGSQKTHIIYGIVILVLILIGYELFSRKPTTITQTKTVIQTVVKTVVQKVLVHSNVVTNRTIQTKKPDGTIVTETDKIVDKTTTKSDTRKNSIINTAISEKTVTSFLSKYTLSVFYPIPTNQLIHPEFTAGNTELILGKRLGQSPVLLQIGTTLNLKSLLFGITLEL